MNDLKIEGLNTRVNSLNGDRKWPVAQRKTWFPVNNYQPDGSLQPSGLFGPETISSVQY